MHIGERIKRARKRAGKEPEDLAKAMKLSGEAIRSWERGDSAPRPTRYAKIAAFLGVTENWIATGAKPMLPDSSEEEELDAQASNFADVMSSLSDDQIELILKVAAQFAKAR